MLDHAIYSERVILGRDPGPALVRIRDGIITQVLPGAAHRARATLDLGSLVLMPGVVDAHVHVNEPGRTEWEGFATAGRAAAAGGVTSIVVMPLNCDPVATNTAALQLEADAAAASCRVDFGFWGGVVPGNERDLRDLWLAGVLGFKCFMVHSGIDEFPNVTEPDLDRALAALAEAGQGGPGPVLLAHAEDARTIALAAGASRLDKHPRGYREYLASRPDEAEVAAIATLIRLIEKHRASGVKAHVVHLAASRAVPILRSARARGVPITVETCPHYLSMSAEQIEDGATLWKCAPPIRDRVNLEGLWSALRDGDIDLIASDHSPCPPSMKQLESGDFARAWGGIASLQLTLPIIWTEASRRGFLLADVARWLCEAPARLAGIDDRKGRFAVGLDADLVAWNPEAEFKVSGAALEHRHTISPYHGRVLRGVVMKTFLRGRLAFDAAEVGEKRFPDGVRGHWLNRTARTNPDASTHSQN